MPQNLDGELAHARSIARHQRKKEEIWRLRKVGRQGLVWWWPFGVFTTLVLVAFFAAMFSLWYGTLSSDEIKQQTLAQAGDAVAALAALASAAAMFMAVDGGPDPTLFARRVWTVTSTSRRKPPRSDGDLDVRAGGASAAIGVESDRWGRAARG